MKTSIKTSLDLYVSDNSSFILENGGNAAEYILADTESQDQGWLWFLSDEEISEYENASSDRRQEIEDEIRNFVNENYSYNLRSEKLLEKWIVVKMNFTDEICVTRRSNFEEMNLCDAYENYGQIVGCCNAGCYALDNSDSNIQSDFLLAIENEMNVKLHSSFGNEFGSCFTSIDELIENIDSLNDLDDESKEIYNYTDIDTDAVRVFAQKWVTENENHTTITGWTYWDGSNHKTITLKAEFSETDCTELDEDDQVEILLEMPESAPYISGTNTSEETENFTFLFDRWADNPWYCYVERK